MLNFKYRKVADERYMVYLDQKYLGKVTKNVNGWSCDNPKSMVRFFRSRRAAAMKLLALDISLSPQYH